MSGKPVAVVTGAARGIGASVVTALASAGWNLVLGDVGAPGVVPGLTYPLASPADLENAAIAGRAAGAHVVTAPCDVRDETAVRELVALAGPGLRAAVSVAGILAADGPTWEQTRADLEADLSVNLHGVANLARAAVPVMLASPEAHRCRFVAVVSSAATRGLPRLSSYVTAKTAALGYIRSLAVDLAPFGMTANAVLPGSTRTRLLERTAEVYGLASVEDFRANQRLGRLLEPREVAAAVAWLCSPEASATTGIEFAVDGGFTG